ncbi:MAG: hypothetical protein Q9222_003329 [Ikaeria aurantiellina]
MLTIRPPNPANPPKSVTQNLLPCRIHHDGPIKVHPRYWNPQPDENGTPEAYFRGRKLKGREVKLPEGYKGVAVRDGVKLDDERREDELKRTKVEDDDDEDEEEEGLKVMDQVAEFGEYMVWGHESVVDGDDGFIKGVEEWIRFAEMMHAPGQDEKTEEERRR